MTDNKADLLSPAFFGGFAGMAITGTVAGFLIGAAVIWLVLATLLTVAALLTVSRASIPRSIESTATGLKTQL